MPSRHRHRSIVFDVIDNHLVRTVTFPDGRHYTHRCTRAVFENVAHAIEEHREQGVTLESLAQALDAPYSQVNVALEFLKERGYVITPAGRGRRSFPASNALFEDAMTEFCFLAEMPH